MLVRGVSLGIVLALAGAAHAQGAWVGDPKSLTLDLAYHYVPSTQIVLTPEMSVPDRPTENHIFTLGAEYVPIENLSVEAALPLAMVRYTGTASHMPAGAWDDGNFHTSLTDLRVGARYQVVDEPILAVSPYVAVTIPVMKYEVLGFATGGRHLKQAHIGLSVGRTISPVLPNLFIMAGYELTLSERYAANEQTKQIDQTRSDIEAQLGYLFLDGDLNVALAYNWRFQHDGIEFENFGMTPVELTQYHDPILKESYMFVGGNASYAITHKITIGLVARIFLRGYNTRDQSLYGIDFAYRAL